MSEHGSTSLAGSRTGIARTGIDGPMVLLVEDEPMLCKIVGELLDEAGYRHVTITDHREIAQAVERWRPQCVVLDGEPPATGRTPSWDDAAAIRKAHPGLPVLMFTANADSIAEARAGTSPRSRAASFAGVVDKPFVVTEFLAALRHAVGSPTARPTTEGPQRSADAVTVFPDIGDPSSTDWVRSDLFSTAVHELRTPLTSVLGQASLALRHVDRDPQRTRAALERTIEQARRMDRLIGELLDHARVSSGALSFEVVTFDLGLAIAVAVPQYDHSETPRVRYEPPPEQVCIRGDVDRVAQILGNLLDNALKYSAPGSPVTVSLTIVDGQAYVRVQDTGAGIAPDERDRIFDPFYRGTRTRALPGTGLGLHISRRLAEQHHGRLWLERSTDTGSVFTLALPVAQPMP